MYIYGIKHVLDQIEIALNFIKYFLADAQLIQKFKKNKTIFSHLNHLAENYTSNVQHQMMKNISINEK